MSNREKSSLSGVGISFWTHESPERVRELLQVELLRQGYCPRQSSAGDLSIAPLRFERQGLSLLRSIRTPNAITIDASLEEDRTVAAVRASSHPLLETLSTPGLVLVNLLVLAWTPALAFVQGYIDQDLGGLYVLALIAMLLGAVLFFPVGIFTTAAYLSASSRLVSEAFLDAEYPSHPLRKAEESAPFGRKWVDATAMVVFPYGLLGILFLSVLPDMFDWKIGLVLLIGFSALLRMLRDGGVIPAITAIHRHLVALCVLLIYLLLGTGAHLRVGVSLQGNGESSLSGDIVWFTLMGIVAYTSLVGWNAVRRSDWELRRVGQLGEFEEHAGNEHGWRFPIITWVLVLISSLSLWAGIILAAGILGLLPNALSSSGPVSTMITSHQSLPWEWQLTSMLLLGTLLALRAASCASFARAAQIDVEPIAPSSQLLEGIEPLLRRARCINPLNVQILVTKNDHGAAHCYLCGWIAPRHVVVLGSENCDFKPGSNGRAILAHELAHCVLRHHLTTRLLRFLGMILLLDPVILTAMQDHSKNEEDADRVAVRLLGGNGCARHEMVSALRNQQRQSSRLVTPNFTPVLHLDSAVTGRQVEAHREGLIVGGLKGLLTYLLSSRVLYVHPSLEHRIIELNRCHEI